MLAQVHSFVLQGIDALTVEVEVDVASKGLPKTTIVGLPDAVVRESIERVRTAITNTGYEFPLTRLLVNLAPADIRKEGPSFDLPIAVGLLLASRVIQTDRHRKLLFAGEMALDGRLRPINGAVSLAQLAKSMGVEGVIVPLENAPEAAAVGGVNVYPADSLATVVSFLNELHEVEPYPELDVESMLHGHAPATDFADVKGQEAAKRAMLIAAAGSHNILMIGPAGTGKTMMAKALPGILPLLSREEALEVTRIFSAAGSLPAGEPLITARPVRMPHHTASSPALIGGGSIPRPGEVSLAHHGVLFLDEMPEFSRWVLETLRQPMEDGEVTIARSHSTVRFPARFMLVAAMNPTPRGDKPTDAVSQHEMDRYLGRISGPLLDRVDIHVEVPAVPHKELMSMRTGTSSATLREQVQRARAIQVTRNGGPTRPNSSLSGRELDRLAKLDEQSQELVRQAMNELGLSARAYDKIRRLARTIADLDMQTNGSDDRGRSREGDAQAATVAPSAIQMHHVAEAIQYRVLDRRR